MGLKEKLTNALDALGDAIKDLSSLDVTTLSGDITAIYATQQGGFDLQAVLTELSKTESSLRGKVYVVASTHMSIDQDATQFVKADLKPEEQSLVKTHLETVKTSLEARNSFLNFAKEFIKPG